jgi:cyclopropane-fatty-acyl-phospholipid synthase
MRILPRLLDRAIRKGRLELIGPAGGRWSFGDGDGPSAAIRVTDPAYDWRIALHPDLHAPEAYMDGALVMERGSVYDLIHLFYLNKPHFDAAPQARAKRRALRRFRRALTHNTVARAARNARSHYDIGNDLYRRMLDRDMQYSCGYWPEGVSTLEAAQTAKKRRIAAKLRLAPGQRVLDIGCGWGGMALYLAAVAEVEVVGVTLAEEQLKVARARADAAGLANQVRFELRDYREVRERFDRVVSVGMLEHVGVGHLQTYFLKLRDVLKPDGLALVHSITGREPPGVTNAFIRKHIFPGGYTPTLSETFAAIEEAGLWSLDVELWRVHYAPTLRAWRENFLATRHELPPAYDDRFMRMWEFYLAACECVFRYGGGSVMQLQLGLERDAAPLTRDYICAAERDLAEREADAIPRLLASTDRAFAGAATG